MSDSDCATCEGTGLFAKKTWDDPEIRCDDCQGTGDGEVEHCLQLIEDVERLISKSNPKLAREVKEALSERIKERT